MCFDHGHGRLGVRAYAEAQTKLERKVLMEKEKKNKILFRLCLGGGAVFVAILVVIGFLYWQGDATYNEAADLVNAPPAVIADVRSSSSSSLSEEKEAPAPEQVAEALSAVSLDSLEEESKDVRYWIYVPDTKINYPVMQGSDNTFYLHHDYKGDYLFAGSIFMDYENHYDFSDFNTILYGHHMLDGSMFAGLIHYMNTSFAKSHPYIYLTRDGLTSVFQVFSTQQVGATSYVYRANFASDEEKQKYIDACLADSVINTGIVPKTNDHLLTLSTCTNRSGKQRWVVHAVMVSV